MSQGPSLIFDKSSLESLNLDEAHPRRLDVGPTSVCNSIGMRFGPTARISDFGMELGPGTR